MIRFSSTGLTAVLLISVAVVWATMPHAWGQVPQEDPADSTAVGQEPDDQGISISVWPAGMQRQVSGYWTSLLVAGTNHSQEDAEETIIATLGDQTQSQFARRFWIPAGARRSGWLMAQVPNDLAFETTSIPLRSIHIKETDRGEEFQNNFLGMPTSVRQLLISRESVRTGVMLEPKVRSYETERNVESLSKFIYAGRDVVVMDDQDLGMSHLDQAFLPTTARALEPFDQIIIANDRVLSDSVATDHLRSWLMSGGRIWVMVDQLEPESVRRLMGDAVRYSTVDRVELNEFDHVQRAVVEGDPTNVEPWSSETPAKLVRVLVDADDVQSEIDGWPTAFWIPVGQGEVLFTTLSPNGWLNDRTPSATYTQIARRFFIQRLPNASQATELTSYLDQQIGYNIPTRASVAGVLGVHMLLVLGFGLVLAKRRALHLLALVVPVAALLATGTLVAFGRQKTASVPSTIAIGQVARAAPNSSEIRIDSLAAIYSQETRELDIRSGHATVAKLVEPSSGEVQRIVWDDSGQSRWMFVEQPPGVVRHVSSQSTVSVAAPWQAQGRFTEQGFEGRINGLDASRCEDVIIVSAASPTMAVSLDAETGTVRTTDQDVLSAGQYIDSALMSDIQQERQGLLRKLLGPESMILNPTPSMLVWTDPFDVGLEFGDGFERRGTLLASIPISLMRQPAGTRFVVPPGFVRLESVRGASGFSSLYNERTGQWLGRDKAGQTQVRCVLPDAVLPCQLERMQIEIKINAPLRTVEIKRQVGDSLVGVFQQQSPTGIVTHTITDPLALQLDAGGGLLLDISVSDTEEERRIARGEITDDSLVVSEDQWQIDYVHITFEGLTQSTMDSASNE